MEREKNYISHPKPQRIKDKKITSKAIERDGYCLYGIFYKDGCLGPLDAHHITFKGAGGDDDLKNIITLCRKHHDQAQSRKIGELTLRKLLNRYYGYEMEI